jgi:hypothetical protein
LLFKVLRGALRFFDTHWKLVVLAAVLSVGLAETISFVIRLAEVIPKAHIKIPGSAPVIFDFNNTIEAFLTFLATIWFQAFIATVAKYELLAMPITFRNVSLNATLLFPHVFLVNLASQFVIFIGIFTGLPAASMLGKAGIVFYIPAICFAVWFALVSPVVVIDEIRSIGRALVRSRLLVSGNFLVVLAALALSLIPVVGTVGINIDNMAFWPVLIFIYVATAIITTMLTISAYINIRLVKGELLIVQEDDIEDESPEA